PTPCNSIALLSSQFPCIPIPIIPNRRRSLAALVEASSGSGSSRMVLAARDAPTEAALIPRNLRRERMFLLNVVLRQQRFFRSLQLLEMNVRSGELIFFCSYFDLILTYFSLSLCVL